MFRVDCCHPNEETPSGPPAFACLATAPALTGDTTIKKGCLLTVGRRNATIVFETDKSVSRDHVHVRVLSQATPHHEPLVLNDSDDQAAAAAGVPTTPEEIESCAASPNGMALVIENVGRFGSSVVALVEASLEADTNNNGDDKKSDHAKRNADKDDGGATDGSDTEDESQEPPPKHRTSLPSIDGVTWFPSTQKLVQEHVRLQLQSRQRDTSTTTTPALLVPKKLETNESFVIPGNATKVIIQVGQTGSMILLTRLNLTFVKSALPKKMLTLWGHRLYAIGATLLDKGSEEELLQHRPPSRQQRHELVPSASNEQKFPSPSTMYIITPKRDVTGKILVAWNLNIPIVTTDFWEALLVQRNTPQDPWPDPAQFVPPIAEHKHHDSAFWNKTTNPFLWESCTLLSIKQVDQEYCVQAAGGTVLRLYGLSEREAHEQVQAVLDDPAKKPGCFALAVSSKKKPALHSWLVEQGVPIISASKVAHFLCQQELLKDENGREIVGTITEPCMAEAEEVVVPDKENKIAPQKQRQEESESTISGLDKRDEANEDQAQKKDTPSPSPKRKRRGSDGAASDEESASKSKGRDHRQKSQSNNRGGLSPVRENDVDDAMQTVQRHRSPRKRSREVEPNPGGDHDTGSQPPSTKRSKRAQSQFQATLPPNDRGVTVDDARIKSQFERQRSRKTPPVNPEPLGSARLETADSGWMVIAPKAEARRQAYVRPREEYALDNAPVEADTVMCSGLVRRPYQPPGDNPEKRGGSSNAKDFKKFRKNHVLKVPAHSRIELRSVLPKETERQRQLQEQQRELEAQQRLADELFGGGGTQSRSTKASITRKRRIA